MSDQDQSHSLEEPATAKTARLPRLQTDCDKKEEEFRLGQGRILGMISANAPLSEILKHLVLLIEAQTPEMVCSVLLLSDDGEHIRHGAAPSLPQEYVKAVDGGPIGPKNGSCGTAMYRGEAVFVTDILANPLWEDYRELAAVSGMRACWSTPIMSGRGKVLGSFAMYYREPRTPTGDEASLTDVATRIAGLTIEHQLAREILARTKAQLVHAQATQSARSGETVASNSDTASPAAVASMVRELNQQLESIVNHSNVCLALLNESQPDVARLREALSTIATDGRHALEVITRIRR